MGVLFTYSTTFSSFPPANNHSTTATDNDKIYTFLQSWAENLNCAIVG